MYLIFVQNGHAFAGCLETDGEFSYEASKML